MRVGVMSARGILQNPALYIGYPVVPNECILDWVHTGLSLGIPYHTWHQHFMYMLFPIHNKQGNLCTLFPMAYHLSRKT